MAESSVTLSAASPHAWAPRRRRYGPLAIGAALALIPAVLPPLLAAVVLAAVGLGLLLLARPTIAIYLLVFAVPYQSLYGTRLGGLNATVTEFIAFCGGAGFLLRSALYRPISPPWALW